jgi:DNA-binding transcriptional MerR regulator
MVVAVEPLTIGQLAARLTVPVRTVRFWSDEGLVDPPARSGGGYRLYDPPSVARLDLVRTLRELGLGLPALREPLARRRTMLHHVATVGSTAEEMRTVHDLATLSARERQQMIDEFVARVIAGVPDDAPGAGIAVGMRTMPAELPAEPTPEQVAAWLELAGLVADDSFEARVRETAEAGVAGTADGTGPNMDRMQTLGRRALADGVAPGSPEAERLVTERFGAAVPGGRTALADRLATFTDARVERYWQLLGVLTDWAPFEPAVPPVEWWIAALRAAPSS